MHTIVFDLDGTLIDSAPDIHAAINRVMSEVSAPLFDFTEVRSFIGNGVGVLMQRVMAARGLDPADHAALLARFLAYYDADATTLTRLYPNVTETLLQLHDRGHGLGICTNKPEAPARAILAEYGLADLFGAVVGGDTLERRKPDPSPLFHTIRTIGDHPAVFVGDSEVDAETAQRAGLPFALYTEGYRKSELKDMPHGVVFSDFADLPQALDRLTTVS